MLETVRTLFHHPGLRRVLVRLRPLIVIAVIAAMAPFVRREWLLPGFLVSMAGEFIQLWAFASLDKNSDLAFRGPYAFVRNPMYLGRFFILLGVLILLGNPWLLLAYAVLYWFYMDTRVEREEALLRQVFGERYAGYCARVGRFVPGAPLPGATLAFWDWRLFRQNNAAMNLALTLVAWAVIAAWVLTRG